MAFQYVGRAADGIREFDSRERAARRGNQPNDFEARAGSAGADVIADGAAYCGGVVADAGPRAGPDQRKMAGVPGRIGARRAVRSYYPDQRAAAREDGGG